MTDIVKSIGVSVKLARENLKLSAEIDRLRAAIECALRQLADGMTVSATATLSDALGEKA